jgi:hypothetical protein
MRFKAVFTTIAIFCVLFSSMLSYAEEKATTQPSPQPATAEKPTQPPAQVTVEKPAESSPIAVLPQDTYIFPSAMEGDTIVRDFVVQNKGNAELEILSVRPG